MLRNFNQKIFFILPAYLWILLFTLIPLLIILTISISKPTLSVPPFKFFIEIRHNHVWMIKPILNNFYNLFDDPIYYKALINSLEISFISTLFCIVVGYFMAYQIYIMPRKYHSLMIMAVILPFWTPSLIRIYSLITIIKNNGILENLFNIFNLTNYSITIMHSKYAVIIGTVYFYLPFMILPIYLSLEKINPKLIEAAQDLGCRPFNIFTKIILPLSIPGVISGIILVFIPSIGDFMIPDLLGGSKIMTIGKMIWVEFFQNRDWTMASAITIMIIFTIIIPLLMIQKIINKSNKRW